MGKTSYIGIDYGHGLSNIDHETGIRFGVINQYDVQAWFDSSEPDYGDPTCPKCGSTATEIDHPSLKDKQEVIEDWEHAEYEGDDFVCEECEYVFGSESAYPDEVSGYVLDDGEYKASSDEYGDIFILKSPYYSYGQFCSPCAPGAIHLGNPLKEEVWNDNNRGYCFDKSFFDGEVAPYRVFRVADETEVL
jgi:hypothetical protein